MAEVKATKSFSYHDESSGRAAVVRVGQVLDESHPAVAGREAYFEVVVPPKRGPGRPPKNRD